MPLPEPEFRAPQTLGRPPRWQWIMAASLGTALALVVLSRPELGAVDHSLADALASLLHSSGRGGVTTWFALLGPTAIAVAIALGITVLPRRPWSSLLMTLLLLGVAMRYLIWRGGTLDQRSSLGFSAGALLLAIEMLYLFIQGLALVPAPLFDPWRRRRQADQLEGWSQAHAPSVDIWIRTADEEERLIRRALISCGNIDYPQITICILDRVGRDSVRRLAESMGARYVDPIQAGAFAGQGGDPLSLAALGAGSGELVAVFESGHMPFANFLRRTAGFFGDAKVVMVQTPLSHFRSEFYNRNLGADQVMPGDRDIFFHYGEVVLDRFNSVQACQSSYLIRRQALRSLLSAASSPAGWESLGAAALQRQGKTIVYLDEILSIGEAPRSFTAFLQQQSQHRHQQLLIALNGGTAPMALALAPLRRGLRLSQFLDQLTPLLRLGFILLPMLALLLGIPLIQATLSDYLIYGLPLIILWHTVPAWLTDQHFSRFWKEITETLTAVMSLERQLNSLFRRHNRRRPNPSPSAVPSGQSINLSLAWPFLLGLGELITVLLLHYILPLIPGFTPLLNPGYLGETLMLIWNLHNGWVMIICLVCAIDQPVRRQGDRLPIHCCGSLQLGSFQGGGITSDLSESGAAFLLNPGLPAPREGKGWLLLDDPDLRLPVELVRLSGEAANVRVAVRFAPLDGWTTGQLLKLLYGGGGSLPKARQISAINAFTSLLGGLWRANPVVRRY